MEVSGQLHASAALPPEKKPQHPLHRRLVGPRSRSGPGGEEKNLSHCRESKPDYSARSFVTILTYATHKHSINKVGIILRYCHQSQILYSIKLLSSKDTTTRPYLIVLNMHHFEKNVSNTTCVCARATLIVNIT
jgi:hypothetical protein